MTDSNYTATFTVGQSPDEVFAAINNVRAWWTGDVEGDTHQLGDEFSYRYEDIHYSRQKLIELVPGQRVVWQVIDSKLNFIADKAEWTGTTIAFDIAQVSGKTELRFTHIGLTPKGECYDACSDAWSGYIKGSLRSLIETGKAQAA